MISERTGLARSARKSGQKWELLSGPGWALALGASLLLVLAWGGYTPFFNPDEGRYASASLEMARGFDGGSPDWVVPHLNGVPRLNKPPLVYWCSALAMRALGPSEVAGRLPSMLAAAGVALLLWAWGRRALDEATGRLAALAWLSSTFPFAFARIANTDMLLAGALALATYGVWVAIDSGLEDGEAMGQSRGEASLSQAGAGSRAGAFFVSRELRGGLIAGIGMGLALLAKGPVGALFPLMTGFAALAASKRWHVLLRPRVWAALGLALAIALAMAWPWVAAVSARVPGFLHRFLIEENLGRYSGAGGVEFHKASPLWFYTPVLIVGLLPWSPFLLGASGGRSERERRALWFWVAWAAVIVVVFSASKTKLASYVLPAFAPLSLLVGACFAARLRREEEAHEPDAPAPEPSPGAWMAALILALLVQVALVLAASVSLLNDKIVPRSEGLPLALALGVAQAVGSVGITRALVDCARRGSRRGASSGVVFGWVWAGAALLHLVLLAGANRIAPYEDSSSVMREISPLLRPDDRVAMLHFQPSTLFYVARPVFIVDFANTSGLEDKAIAASKYFPRTTADPGLLERWRGEAPRTFVLCRSNSPGLDELSQRWILLARTNDHLLFCNRDAPPGFKHGHDFVAPRKQER